MMSTIVISLLAASALDNNNHGPAPQKTVRFARSSAVSPKNGVAVNHLYLDEDTLMKKVEVRQINCPLSG
jgi:hypothetical protein